MEIDRGDIRVGIAIGDSFSLPSWSRTTVENIDAVANQSCNELRGLILNDAKACPESGSLGDVPAQNSSRGGQQSAGSEFDSFGAELLFCFCAAKTDCSYRDRLIVLANAKSGIESIGLGPAFDEPRWMSAAGCESLDGSSADRGLSGFVGRRNASRHFSQHGIHEGSGRTLPGALDEFDALKDGGTRGNASEPAQLINS